VAVDSGKTICAECEFACKPDEEDALTILYGINWICDAKAETEPNLVTGVKLVGFALCYIKNNGRCGDFKRREAAK
jgi:hypothetical protein